MVTVDVAVLLHPFAATVMLKTVDCATSKLLLVSVPFTGTLLPLRGIPLNCGLFVLVQLNAAPEIPLGFVAVMVKVDPEHKVWVAGETDMDGVLLTVAITAVLVAVEQPLSDELTQ